MNVVYIALFQLFLHHVNGDASYFFFFYLYRKRSYLVIFIYIDCYGVGGGGEINLTPL